MTARVELLGESLDYSLGGAAGIYAAVNIGIPSLADCCGVPPVIGWFVTSGCVVTLFFIAAIAAARRRAGARSVHATMRALRLHRPNAGDLVWAVGGLSAVVLLTVVVVSLVARVFAVNLLARESYSSFLHVTRLEPGEYWLFLAWLPYFFFNIAGEELLWRGYLLPRQVAATGSSAWILNGVLWAVFHAAIGWRIAVVLLPIEFVVPYIVQRRRNTWIGILIHGAANGSGFVLVALGIVN